MAFAQGLPLRAEESFGLERFRKEEKMSHVARTVKFMLDIFILIILIACAIWWAAFIYFFLAYGLAEAIAFAIVSISLIILVCSMIYHDRP